MPRRGNCVHTSTYVGDIFPSFPEIRMTLNLVGGAARGQQPLPVRKIVMFSRLPLLASHHEFWYVRLIGRGFRDASETD